MFWVLWYTIHGCTLRLIGQREMSRLWMQRRCKASKSMSTWRQNQTLEYMISDPSKWMYNSYAHPKIVYWIPWYIQMRGSQKLTDFPHFSAKMKKVAAQQDLIPWQSFMEEKSATSTLPSKGMHLHAHHQYFPLVIGLRNWSIKLCMYLMGNGYFAIDTLLRDAPQGYLKL